MPPDPIDARIDAVLPPDGKGRAPTGQDARDASEVTRIIAHWMDEFLRIPGTNIRFGLDPLLGVFPVAGGLLSSSISVITLIEGVRLRVPLTVLARMGVNVFLNQVFESIPVAGNIASVFFRSNSRNLALINRWTSGESVAVTRGSRILVGFILAVLFLLIAGWLFIWVTVVSWVWDKING